MWGERTGVDIRNKCNQHAAETRIGNRPQEPGRSLDTAEKEEEQDPGEWAAEEEYAEDEDSTHTHVTHTYTQDARKAAEGPVNPLTPIPRIIASTADAFTKGEAGCRPAASEPFSLSGGELALKNLMKLDAACGESAQASTSGTSATSTLLKHA